MFVAFNKLARTLAAQVEALKRYRSSGEQAMRVEHVTVNNGGQAIVGNVASGGGPTLKSENQPYALRYATGPALPSQNSARDTMPIARDEERPLPDARRAISRTTEGK
jgi:hypothetical protein